MDINEIKQHLIMNREVREIELRNTYSEFMQVTNHDELIIIILRGHLYIERELIKILEKVFDDNSYQNLTFSQKVDLCNSLGLIEKEKVGSLRKLNKQRNGYAHSLEYSLTEKDYNDLLSTLSQGEKKLFDSDFKAYYKTFSNEETLKDNYRILLASIWASIKMDNMFFFAKYKYRSDAIIEREINKQN